MLVPTNIPIEEVLVPFREEMLQLNEQGIEVNYKSNGVTKSLNVKGAVSILVGDTPQAHKYCRTLGTAAKKSCRSCNVGKKGSVKFKRHILSVEFSRCIQQSDVIQDQLQKECKLQSKSNHDSLRTKYGLAFAKVY
jgi:hypothetical protein